MDYQTVNNLQSYGGGLLTTQGITTSPINVQSTTTGGSGGQILNQAGDLLTGGIFSSVLSAIKNLSNIGASTNPTQEMNSFLGHIQPRLESKMASIIESNAGAVLTSIDQELMFNWNGYKHLLEHHARASSTKEAYRVVMAKCMELRSAVHNYISGLKNGGAKVSQTTKSSDFNALEASIQFADGRKFDRDHKYTVTWNVYTVTLPKPKPVDNTPTQTPNPTLTNNNTNDTISDEPVQQQQAGSGGLMMFALIGTALWMMFKKK